MRDRGPSCSPHRALRAMPGTKRSSAHDPLSQQLAGTCELGDALVQRQLQRSATRASQNRHNEHGVEPDGLDI